MPRRTKGQHFLLTAEGAKRERYPSIFQGSSKPFNASILHAPRDWASACSSSGGLSRHWGIALR